MQWLSIGAIHVENKNKNLKRGTNKAHTNPLSRKKVLQIFLSWDYEILPKEFIMVDR